MILVLASRMCSGKSEDRGTPVFNNSIQFRKGGINENYHATELPIRLLLPKFMSRNKDEIFDPFRFFPRFLFRYTFGVLPQ